MDCLWVDSMAKLYGREGFPTDRLDVAAARICQTIIGLFAKPPQLKDLLPNYDLADHKPKHDMAAIRLEAGLILLANGYKENGTK